MKIQAILAAVRHARSSAIAPWAVLGLGILGSLSLFAVIDDNVESAAEERFGHQTTEAKRVIETRIQSYANVLYSVRAQFAVDGKVGSAGFQRFVRSLDLDNRFPGFEVVNYAVHVRAEERQRFVDRMRHANGPGAESYSSFAIKPPGDRPEYHVLVFLEPLAGNEFALGLDVAANPASSNPEDVAAALRLARDSGQLTASGRLIRVRRAKEFIGLAMRLPVYRNGVPLDTVEQRRAAYAGSVGAGFNVENLMRGVLSEGTLRHLRFRVYDTERGAERPVTDLPEERLLFDSNQLIEDSPQSHGEPDSMFSRMLPMEIGGRVWEIHFSGRKDAIIDRTDKLFSFAILAGGLLSSLLVFTVLYFLASSRSQALKIAAQMTQDLRATSRRLVEVQEAERRLLASELHDRVGQNLTALGLNLSIVANGLPPDAHPELAARLEDSSQLVQGTVDAMRDVMVELRPSALDDYGLPAALRSLAAGFSRRTGIQVAFEADEPSPGVPKAVDLAMFRIAQEALNNIAKHSSADRVEMAIRRVNGHATLSVRDNGVGFDLERTDASTAPGWGLLIMRERAEAVGAEFSVRADPDAGVQVLVEYGVEKGT
jgi:signal transduction histidine kinase